MATLKFHLFPAPETLLAANMQDLLAEEAHFVKVDGCLRHTLVDRRYRGHIELLEWIEKEAELTEAGLEGCCGLV